MMSLSLIRELAHEAAEAAAENGDEPFVYATADEVEEYGTPFPFPFLGDYVPEGWTLEYEHFADSSGLGSPDEPALTVDELMDLILRRRRENAAEGLITGWAITQAGQFQVYVGEYTRPMEDYR